MTTVPSAYTPPTKQHSIFCKDAAAVKACAKEFRTTKGIASDECSDAAALYAIDHHACSEIMTKADVSVDCKRAIGGTCQCFGSKPSGCPSCGTFIVCVCVW